MSTASSHPESSNPVAKPDKFSEILRGADLCRSILENGSDVITLLDGDGVIHYAGPAVRRVLGYVPSALLGQSFLSFLDGVDANRVRDLLLPVPRSPEVRPPFECRFRHADGSWRTLEAVVSPIVSGHQAGVVVNARDITDHRTAEVRQRESEQRYRALFDLNPLPMWVYDRETLRFLAVNDAAVQTYGYSRDEFLTRTIKDIRPPEDVRALEEALRNNAGGDRVAGIWRHRKKNGSTIDVAIRSADFDVAGWPARLVLAEDVTTQNRLEEQLRQAQKMDALGRLAGSVAHDFNNLLSIICGYAEQLLRHLSEEDPSRRRVAGIQQAAERAAGLTRQLLTFSRHEHVRPQVISLSRVLSGMETLFRRLIGADIELVMSLAADLGRTKLDPTHVEQVLMNFVVNARDAMPKGGRLCIETANVTVDETFAAAAPDLEAGRYVLLSVTDTGHGMSPDVRDHIFEPFFTTKERGRGTGLGLAIVYGIVKQAGGRISVYSEPGHGTTFKVYLPRMDDAEALAAAGRTDLPHGSETILLVEDDDEIRGIVRENLADFGYTVIEARDAREAHGAFEAAGGRVGLLLTDLVIGPGKSGQRLAAELVACSPGIKVVAMSGYAEGSFSGLGGLPPGTVFLPKPVNLGTLLQTVRAALDSGSASPV